jgi:hypothetical protein
VWPPSFPRKNQAPAARAKKAANHGKVRREGCMETPQQSSQVFVIVKSGVAPVP